MRLGGAQGRPPPLVKKIALRSLSSQAIFDLLEQKVVLWIEHAINILKTHTALIAESKS